MKTAFGLAACAVLALACLILAAAAFTAVRQERLAQRRRVPTEQELYEQGRKAASAAKRTRDDTPDTPLARRLHAAGMDVTPRVWTAGVVIGALVACATLTVISGSAVAGVGVAVAVPIAARMLVDRRIRKQSDLFDVQFAQALPQISASVRGSLTLERALRVATAHMDDPLKGEFARVLADAAYGVPLHRALEDMAQRTQHADVKTLAAATRIRQRRGGSVGAALDMIATHVNARLKARRELKTEVASAKMAKWFVAAAMPAIFLIMYATNASFAQFYAVEPLGWLVLGVAAACEVVGLLVAHKITNVRG